MRVNILVTALLFLIPQFLFAGMVSVKVEEMDKQEGKVFWALHKEADYLKDGHKPFIGGTESVDKMPFEFSISDVPPGEYALVLFQDLDGNEELNTAIFSYPLEPYGFSKNPTIYFGPPSFTKTAFNVSDSVVELNIKLK